MDASLGSSLTRIRSTGSDAVVSDQKRVVAIKRAPAPSTSRARVASRRVDAARGSVAGSTARLAATSQSCRYFLDSVPGAESMW